MATNQGLYYYSKEEIDELNAERSTYSTAEKEVGTWIDGSTIYQKTIDFGALPNNTSKTVAHNISNMNYAVKIEGVAVAAGNRTFPLPTPPMADSNVSGIRVEVNTSGVTIRTDTDRTSFTGYITIWYVKVAA